MNGLVMHYKAINKCGKQKSILKKHTKKTFFLNYNLNICYPINNIFEFGISVYNHAPLK